MKILSIEIRNLNKFLKHFENLGYEVVEGPHAILTDDSEIGVWYVRRDNDIKAEIMAHYVDTHYWALMNISSSTSDKEIIRALIMAQGMNLWRVPVEPIIVTIYEDALGKNIEKYSDDYESVEAIEAVRHYLVHKDAKVLEKVHPYFRLKRVNT